MHTYIISFCLLGFTWFIGLEQSGIEPDRKHIGRNQKRDEDNERKNTGARTRNQKP